MDKATQGQLRRGLKNRHIQLVALGGAIGTGLFLGVSQSIQLAGPSALLGYALGGVVAFLIMRQLGEMVVEEPVAGSFSHFAHRYWGDFAGFLSGWNYWALYILVGMAELTAVGIYVHHWFPDVPTWVSAAVCFVLINAVNLAAVRFFGEFEFWFAIIKVVAILGMIAFGGWLLLSGQGDGQASIENLWRHGGFFPNGLKGFVVSLAVIMFSFGGLELVGIAAAEAENPRKTIPLAVNQVVYRILIFYVGLLAVLLALHPWNQVADGGSPIVQIFASLGQNTTAHIFNVVVLTAALSVYNSGVYCNSRMLYGLASQGNAPRALRRVDRRGVPFVAIGVSALVTAVCVVLNYAFPKDAFQMLLALVVASLVLNWALISATSLRFRAARERAGQPLHFKAVFYPYANYFCLGFMALILVILALDKTMWISVALLPPWLLLNWAGWLLKRHRQGKSGDSAVK